MSEPLINISRRSAYTFACLLVCFEFLTYISNDMIMPAMLQVTHTFQASQAMVAASLSMYVLGGSTLQLFLGPLSDAIGRRPVLLFGICLFITFTLLIGCSQSSTQFLWGRFFQGMGLCFIMIGYASLHELFEEKDAVRLIALLTNTATIAPLIGPLAGAFFVLYLSWRDIYWIVTVLTCLTFIGMYKVMPETVGVPKCNGPATPFISLHPRVVFGQYFSLLKTAPFMAGVFALGLQTAPCLAWIGIAPLILMVGAKLSVVQYALLQIPLFSGFIIGNFILRRLTLYFVLKRIVQMGSCLTFLSLVSMAGFAYLFQGHYLTLVIGLTAYSIGAGITAGPIVRLLLFSVNTGKGTTNALINMINMCILAACTELANYLYHSHHNIVFANYCACLGVAYFLLTHFSLYYLPTPTDHESTK